MAETNLTILADGLRKRYGGTRSRPGRTALDGVDLAVAAGTVHGLLGPNGAGKTTAVRILGTLLRPDAGTARVAGFDVRTQAAQVRAHIGLVGQNAAVDEVLSGAENLVLFGRLHHLDGAAARRRAAELLERFDLVATAGTPVSGYSGGMRRRLDLAAGLILSPPVLFLDEPTTGLDPRGRQEVWDTVRALAAAGTTVLLTTQYLEEADQLADRVTVLDGGRVRAEGSPAELKEQLGGDRLEVVVHDHAGLSPAAGVLAGLAGTGIAGAEPVVDADLRRLSVPVDDRMAALAAVLPALAEAGVAVEDVTVRRPTLDEVFLALTEVPA